MEILIDDPDVLLQYVFHYKNKQTGQEIRYILSKSISRPEKLLVHDKVPMKIDEYKQGYYRESDTSQSVWWEGEKGFLSRFVYYINDNREKLDNKKLTQSELLDLAKQVQ
ncbi:hypothetical protein [Paenibacillus sp. KN14-4R]|uniref:hypothetical protein n=1 Tax=Paenibacillus sp. KN14-4R TaxID=3445773 RepID=UPI003FA01FCD